MYVGNRRALDQGTVSWPVITTTGIPLGGGHAFDFLHACLAHVLQATGRQIEWYALRGQLVFGLPTCSSRVGNCQHSGLWQEVGGCLQWQSCQNKLLEAWRKGAPTTFEEWPRVRLPTLAPEPEQETRLPLPNAVHPLESGGAF
eukprot:2236587-Amphidinium_carterae.1